MAAKNRMLSAVVAVALSLISMTSHSEVDQVCIDRFQANGAIPGNAQCEILALTSPASLSNFGCTATAGPQIVAEFCGLIDDMECKAEKPVATVSDTGSVTFDVEPNSPIISPELLQLFLFSNSGLLDLADETGSVDPSLIFALIFGLSLPVVASSNDFTSLYSGFALASAGTGDLTNCP